MTDDVLALGDAEQVLRIGRSLVENALRHTPAGTRIELRAAIWVDRAELSVHDDGPGIPEAEQQRVFDRFFRGEGSSPEGSGIGLAIARELAQRMGGGDRAALAARQHDVYPRAPAAFLPPPRFHVKTCSFEPTQLPPIHV